MLWTWRSSGNADVTHDHQEQKDESKLCLSGPQSSAETKASFHFRTGQIGFCLEKETADWAEQPVLFHHSRFYFCAVVVYIYKYPIWVEPDQMNVLPRHRFTPFSSVASELGVPPNCPHVSCLCPISPASCTGAYKPLLCLKVSSLHLVRLLGLLVLDGFGFEFWGLKLGRWTWVPTYFVFFFFFWSILFQKLDVFAPLNTHLSCPPLNTLWLCLISLHNEKGKGFTRC